MKWLVLFALVACTRSPRRLPEYYAITVTEHADAGVLTTEHP